jgi:DNA-binding NtrC family response regulator
MARATTRSSEGATTCSAGPDWLQRDPPSAEPDVACLVVAWSAAEPERVGEAAWVPEDGPALILGRGGASPGDPDERLCFFEQRPGSVTPTTPLKGSGMSRRQCLLRAARGRLEVECVGRCPVFVDGHEVRTASLVAGQTLTVKDELVLYVTRRGPWTRLCHFDPRHAGAFARADRYGLVGESPAAWELREQLAFAAASGKHVLVLGESGTGKELAAHALHAMSARAGRPMVARNAATFPSTLVDAELFGTANDYPNAGMPARPGVIGLAHRSTLFLDEIAELPLELQSHLLRVLDRGGGYSALGDASARHSDFRLVAATNRDPADLRPDMAARFTLSVTVPALDDRPEDIPLIVRHLLLQAARATPAIATRFCAETPGGLDPRIDPDLVEQLLRYEYRGHVRELEALLWKAVSASSRNYVALTPEVREQLSSRVRPMSNAGPGAGPSRADGAEPTAHEITACLARHRNHVPSAAHELGLRSRYALYRLMRKHGIRTP